MKMTVKWRLMRRIWRTDWPCHKTPRSLWKRPDSAESLSDVGLDSALVGSVVDSALVGSVADSALVGFAVDSALVDFVADFVVDSVAEDSVAEDSVAADSVAVDSVAAASVVVDSVAVDSEEDAGDGAEFAAEQQLNLFFVQAMLYCCQDLQLGIK
jgi:hypothetical protein